MYRYGKSIVFSVNNKNLRNINKTNINISYQEQKSIRTKTEIHNAFKNMWIEDS